jgi:uncharacterized protein YcbK (DUF882 family)
MINLGYNEFFINRGFFMGDLSKDFSRSEFQCKGKACGCSFATVDAQLLEILQDIRDHFGLSVRITSAARCPVHNENVGGAMPNPLIKDSGSKHLRGIAADIQIDGVEPFEIYSYVNKKYTDKFGIICYKSFVHIDVRLIKYRKVY